MTQPQREPETSPGMLPSAAVAEAPAGDVPAPAESVAPRPTVGWAITALAGSVLAGVLLVVFWALPCGMIVGVFSNRWGGVSGALVAGGVNAVLFGFGFTLFVPWLGGRFVRRLFLRGHGTAWQPGALLPRTVELRLPPPDTMGAGERTIIAVAFRLIETMMLRHMNWLLPAAALFGLLAGAVAGLFSGGATANPAALLLAGGLAGAVTMPLMVAGMTQAARRG